MVVILAIKFLLWTEKSDILLCRPTFEIWPAAAPIKNLRIYRLSRLSDLGRLLVLIESQNIRRNIYGTSVILCYR